MDWEREDKSGSVAKVSSDRVSSSGSTISTNEYVNHDHVLHDEESEPRIEGCRSRLRAAAFEQIIQLGGKVLQVLEFLEEISHCPDRLQGNPTYWRRTSAFKTSNTRSLALGPHFSSSGERLSKLQTETRLLVVLCIANCTFQGPTLKGGVEVAAGSAEGEDDSAGEIT